MNTIFNLFFVFFEIGLFAFGGDYSVIALLPEKLVARGWISSAALGDLLLTSGAFPGSLAVNIANYVGFNRGGFLGAVFATIGVMLPTFLFVVLALKIFAKIDAKTQIKNIAVYIKPLGAAMVACAFLLAAQNIFFPLWTFGRSPIAVIAGANFVPIAVFLLFLALGRKKEIKPTAAIISGGVLGVIFCTLATFLQIPI